MRAESSDRSEQVSQLLFGETFEIIETHEQWRKIKTSFDQYEGWIDQKQYFEITENQFHHLTSLPQIYCNDLVEFIQDKNKSLQMIPLGANLTFLQIPEINIFNYLFDGQSTTGTQVKSDIISKAFMYLNVPYLWGGKTPYGIDCSGFTQMVYQLNGYYLLRDASQQATQGEALSFIEESEPGDLAFFDNADGKIIHVGIIMENNYIIHAHGKVRIDRLDHLGIFNTDTERHTHRLRVIKRIV
jgi:cell wall-associated NlpC family hydrolase